MSNNLIQIISALFIIAISFIPKFVNFLFPTGSEEEIKRVIELLELLLKTLFESLTMVI